MGLAARKTMSMISRADFGEVRSRVRAAGSSFYWAMRLLPRYKREALFGIYAFCRDVDDIADGSHSGETKIELLGRWRAMIDGMYAGRATDATTRVLVEAIRRYSLKKTDFLAIVDGMEMDVRGAMFAPRLEDLYCYCDRVAGAVGRLCIRVFGEAENGREVADTLGRALQLTNILRDVEEDAARGRLYLPRELLEREALSTLPAPAILENDGCRRVMAAVGAIAEHAFAESERALKSVDLPSMRPAIVMMKIYRQDLRKLKENGWRPVAPRAGLARTAARIEKFWIALHHGFF